MRYRDQNGQGWANIIDMLTMYPNARRPVVRMLGGFGGSRQFVALGTFANPRAREPSSHRRLSEATLLKPRARRGVLMRVLRIKPNILSTDLEASRRFYLDVLGLEEGGGLDWISFFGGDTPEVQLSVMQLDIHAHVHPDVSIEVDDVRRFHQRAVDAGVEIVYQLTHEPWGLTRFFMRDPNGAVINVTQHD
jgi:catechol 2,3-dioxygenase-like lactoylglutathione lyase family enzyme